MKTRIATFVFLSILFITATAFASEPVPASQKVAASVADFIEQELEYPDFAIDNKYEGDVLVEVLIEEDGTFDVVTANAYDKQMKQAVIRMIEEMDSDDFDRYAGQTVLVRISFDLKMV